MAYDVRTYSETPEPRFVEKAVYAENGAIPEVITDILEGDEFITVDETEEGDKVQISIDSDYKPWIVELTGNSGTLTDGNYAKLTISEKACIINNHEIYYKCDEQEGFTVFIHNGRDNQQQIYSKAIYVYTDSESAISYKTWTLVSTKTYPITVDGIDTESGNLGKFMYAGTTGAMWRALPPSASVDYVTEAPTEANLVGLKFAVLTSEPQSKYDGWYYIITEA